MPEERIATAEEHYSPGQAGRPDKPAEWPVQQFWPGYVEQGMPLGLCTSGEAEALAEVNHGRWIVRCPFCPSAQVASAVDRRMFCVDCGNAAVGGRWVPVRWPRDPGAIEQVLLERPRSENRNWSVHENVAALRRENEEHGLGRP